MPVSQNVGVETVKSTIDKMEDNSYCHQALPKINDLPAMRGGESEFTTERKRRVSPPSNSSASK